MLSKIESRKNIREFHYNFAEELRRLRNSKNLSLEHLAFYSCVPVHKLRDLEIGQNKDWGTIFQLARYYEKKIRLEFYD